MQGICQFRALVGGNVATVFGHQGDIHFPEDLQNVAAGEFFSKLLFQRLVYQKDDVTDQKVGFYAVFLFYNDRSCFEFCFYDPETSFNLSGIC